MKYGCSYTSGETVKGSVVLCLETSEHVLCSSMTKTYLDKTCEATGKGGVMTCLTIEEIGIMTDTNDDGIATTVLANCVVVEVVKCCTE